MCFIMVFTRCPLRLISFSIANWSELGIKLGWVSPPVGKVKIAREPAVGRGRGEGEGPFLQETAESLSS